MRFIFCCAAKFLNLLCDLRFCMVFHHVRPNTWTMCSPWCFFESNDYVSLIRLDVNVIVCNNIAQIVLFVEKCISILDGHRYDYAIGFIRLFLFFDAATLVHGRHLSERNAF